MKKLDYNSCRQLMKLLTILVELDIIDLSTFMSASVDVGEITILEGNDYVDFLVNLMNPED